MKDAKDRILQAAIALLESGSDPAAITVREIAKRAGVGTGSINYHFQSKDALLNDAVSALMMEEANKWFAMTTDTGTDPETRLRLLFKSTSRIAARYPRLMRVMLSYGFQTGEWGVPVMILPLLREIFGSAKDELRLRLLALQLVLPLQAVAIAPAAFQHYAGLDLFNDAQRDQMIDLFIDNLLSEENR